MNDDKVYHDIEVVCKAAARNLTTDQLKKLSWFYLNQDKRGREIKRQYIQRKTNTN